MTLHLTTALLGAGFALTILMLVRRDHLHISHGVFWVLFALGALTFGIFPTLSDVIASRVGISYGPTLILVVAFGALVLRSLQADIATTRMERDIRRISQELSLLRAAIRSNEHCD